MNVIGGFLKKGDELTSKYGKVMDNLTFLKKVKGSMP